MRGFIPINRTRNEYTYVYERKSKSVIPVTENLCQNHVNLKNVLKNLLSIPVEGYKNIEKD